MTEWMPLIITMLTIITSATGGVVTVVYRRMETLGDKVLALSTKNAQLEAEIVALRDDLNVERESHRIDNERHERQIRNLVDENRILRDALRAQGFDVDRHSAETPPRTRIIRRTEGERGE